MSVKITSILVSVGNILCNLTNTQPTKSPQPTPPTTTHIKRSDACWISNEPVAIAITANCIMMSADASFKRLSPSKMVENRLGMFTNLVMALVLTESVGDKMLPRRSPRAIVNPGINQ